MFDWLLQAGGIATQVADSLSKAAPAVMAPKEMHLWDVLKSGGPLMIPLSLMLIGAIFFFFEN